MDSDTLHAALVDAFDTFLAFLPDAVVRRGPGYRVVSTPSFPLNLANAVWCDGPDEAAAIQDLPDALAEIRARDLSPAVVVRDGVTAGVQEEALRLGLTHEERLPGMTVDLGGFRRPPRPGSVTMRRVGDDPALLDVVIDVTARGFGAPRDWFTTLLSNAIRADGLHLWLAYVNGEPVSTALGFVQGDAVGIFDVATPPEHRRKGYGGLVTAEAVAAGFDAGASFAYLQSSEMGFSVYEALGFKTVTTYVIMERAPSPDENATA